MFQVMNLKEGEMEWLGSHLGHTVNIHKEAYRLHDSVLEMAKVSKLLLAVDSGTVGRLQGKTLDDITIDGMVIVLELQIVKQ